jgi:hypothetical protein
VRFSGLAARPVAEREWHPSQEVQGTTGDGVEVTMRLGSLFEVKRWVLGRGREAEVLGPAALLRMVDEERHG